MKLIKIEGAQLEINDSLLLVPEFSKLYNTSKDKSIGINLIKVVYLFTDYNSAYKEYSEEDRKKQLEKDFKVTFNEDVTNAINKYKELSNTFSMKFLDAAINAANQTLTYFNNVDYNAVDLKGNPIYKIKEVTDALKNCMGVITTLESLKIKVYQEQIGSNKVRGGGDISDFEKE